MPRDEPLQCACPPIALSDVVGKKWATRVVTLLGSHGPLGFGRLHAALPRVSPTTLVSTLRELEHGHLVVRVPVPGDGRSRGEYRLTPMKRHCTLPCFRSPDASAVRLSGRPTVPRVSRPTRHEPVPSSFGLTAHEHRSGSGP